MQIDTVPMVASLQGQIQLLTDLYNRIQALRQVPPLLLKSPLSNELPLSAQSLRSEFQQVKEIGDTVRSDPVQEALRKAGDSLKADRWGDLDFNPRRDTRKRRRPPSPESPKPYIPLERKNTSLFPLTDDDLSPLRADGLTEYIRDFNRVNKSKLHIWRRTRANSSPAFEQPVVVRFTVPDVLTAYITLGYNPMDPVLVAESLTTFAPRERKAPHSQSDYGVYQNLSQQIAKMLQSHFCVSFQTLMGLLRSYERIFIDRCTSCERVLSAEGHVPPVVRIWIDPGKEGRWDPRHVGCRQG